MNATIIERARAVPIELECAQRGIALKGKAAERCGPCPICGGTDRFSINIRKQIYHCRGCKVGGDVIDMVRHLDSCSFREAVELLTGEQPRALAPPSATKTKQSASEYEREQRRKASWLWLLHRPISGTIAERYLRGRGITCPLPPTLGFLPPQKPEHHPAMIAAFGLPAEPEPGVLGAPPHTSISSVHLTLLRPDGSGKATVEKPKFVVGSPGALPIVIAPSNVLGIAITEGIEDGLTVHEATGLGVWVAGSAGRLPRLAAVIPNYIECVTIYAHSDENGAGQNGAHQPAQALHQRGIEVIVEGVR
jgi:putative DNA primase/helicase